MVELGLQTNIEQTLSLMLAPRLIEMLKILQLPYQELVDQINKESEENVMLEVERGDQYLELIRYLNSDKKIKKEADFSEMPGLENIGKVEKTLEDHLLEQLEFEDLEESLAAIGKEIIGNIDDQGYLIAYPKLRERIMEVQGASRPTVDKVLKIIQGFEPEGVGARDLAECLKIQIEAYNFESPELEKIISRVVEHHLPDLEANNTEKIMRELKITANGINEIKNFIKNNLNPYPGSAYGGETRQVIPSFAVEQGTKDYIVTNLETRYGPSLKLSPEYLKMLENPKTDQKTRDFLKEKMLRAKELLEAFEKRNETLLKIVRKIIEAQEDFLEKGIIYLKPLSQKSLADEFGLHPSTISRAVAQKYIQTPGGMFPLKFLCPRGPKGMTVGRLKAMLVEIIQQEDKKNPMTDEKITEILRERGSGISRRTTAYYRKELKIPAIEGRRKDG